jgi:hypothetical protein
VKRAATFVAVGVVVGFAVLVVRETAALVVLARSFDPRLGHAVLWLLVATYAVCLGVPALMFLRLRRPLVPPDLDAGDEVIAAHLGRVASRLSRHRLIARPVEPSVAAIDASLRPLDDAAEREMRREASLVFLSTAVSQSGRLDALFVLVAQTRLIWRIAHVYWQRPTAREFLFLYANVAASVFAAQSLEDLDMAEVLEPVVPAVVEAAGLGVTVVLAPVATVLADATFQGTVNALLTLRVGCITRRYCRGLPLPDRRAVRRAASREAAAMLPKLIAEPMRKLRLEATVRMRAAVKGAARTAAGRITGSVGSVNPFRRSAGDGLSGGPG